MNDCRFCDSTYQNGDKTVMSNEYCFANFDGHPVTGGHMKVIPRRHMETYFEMTSDEVGDIYKMICECKKMLDEKHNPDGYNIGVNCGKEAGQTVFHLHIHLIPRYKGDVPDPTGGIRNVIPEKGNYLKNP
ncbi:MAG: HIT family protein [Patescibacteria group bacterium]